MNLYLRLSYSVMEPSCNHHKIEARLSELCGNLNGKKKSGRRRKGQSLLMGWLTKGTEMWRDRLKKKKWSDERAVSRQPDLSLGVSLEFWFCFTWDKSLQQCRHDLVWSQLLCFEHISLYVCFVSIRSGAAFSSGLLLTVSLAPFYSVSRSFEGVSRDSRSDWMCTKSVVLGMIMMTWAFGTVCWCVAWDSKVWCMQYITDASGCPWVETDLKRRAT